MKTYTILNKEEVYNHLDNIVFPFEIDCDLKNSDCTNISVLRIKNASFYIPEIDEDDDELNYYTEVKEVEGKTILTRVRKHKTETFNVTIQYDWDIQDAQIDFPEGTITIWL